MKNAEWTEGIDQLPGLQNRTRAEAVDVLVRQEGIPAQDAGRRLDQWHEWGLWADDIEEGIDVLHPTHQFLGRPGAFDRDTIGFLGGAIDDLWARRALLDAGNVVVESLALDVLSTGSPSFLPGILPGQLAHLSDKSLALRFYGAGVSLMTNLSAGRPASSFAEEICAVFLVDMAEELLDMRLGNGVISQQESEQAQSEVLNLFELFGDGDIFGVFDGTWQFNCGQNDRDLANSLFEPLWGEPITGYLGARI